jgi:DNA-binding NarL/FixJ family response regulator
MTGAGELVTQPVRQPIMVLCVDDQACFIDALRALIEAAAEFVSVGAERCGEDAIEAARRLRPDLVLMDVRMPGIGGLQAARTLLEQHPRMLVVLMSAEPELLPADAARAGRLQCVLKERLTAAALTQLWRGHEQGLLAKNDPVA